MTAEDKRLGKNKALIKYQGLYGDRANKEQIGELYLEKLETRSPAFNWEIQPHLHQGMWQIFFITSGTFDLSQADRQEKLKAPCVLLIPSLALHGFRFNPEVSGQILSFSQTHYQTITTESISVKWPEDQVSLVCNFEELYSAESILTIIDFIDRELANPLPGKEAMLRACMQQLLLLIYRLKNSEEPVSTQKQTPANRHYMRFLQLLELAGGDTTISGIASQMKISPVHLNRICQEKAGKPAGQLLQERLIREAKKYLSYTSYPVTEIAYLLRFEYANYFARFFRKHTGLSPKEFRSKTATVATNANSARKS